MMEFGSTLRAAREARGLTVGQVADTTHMAPSTVEDLEKEDFSRIAAPIYGRGFVKLYCEAVGLDPKPLIAEFMDIFNGNRDTGIKDVTLKLFENDRHEILNELDRETVDAFILDWLTARM